MDPFVIAILIVLGLVFLLTFAKIIAEAAAAPMGWEDDNGFHYGEKGKE